MKYEDFSLKMRQFIYLITVILCLGCNNSNEENKIAFIGDSIIARWDIEKCFFSYKIENLGLPGSGIDYIEQFNPNKLGNTTVVLTGTNDLSEININNIGDYVQRYIKAILNINSDRIILISILPRKLKEDNDDINLIIAKINTLIYSEIKKHIKVVYINAYPDFLKDGYLNMNYSYDGVHINEYGYEILSTRIKKLL